MARGGGMNSKQNRYVRRVSLKRLEVFNNLILSRIEEWSKDETSKDDVLKEFKAFAEGFANYKK